MDSEHWSDIQNLFEAVADLDSDERNQYLAEHCKDQNILKEVLDLLQADEEVEEIMPKTIEPDEFEQTLVIPKLHPETQVGPYKIISKIGEGGMGWVFKAEDTRLGRLIALKCLAPAAASDPGVKERLLLEAKAISRIDHPNVCVIHDMGHTDDGGLFIAMQYYHGKTLEEHLKSGPLTLRRTIKVAKQIAHGLSAAHQLGIIHRDIKPANILIQENGVVKILDFGIAKMHDSEITLVGARIGTLAYMAPEQLEGGQVGPYTDVWALATLIYEMLTGSPLHSSEKASAILNAVMNDEAHLDHPSLKQHPHLQRLLRGMLIKNPALRLNSMIKVVQWLNNFQNHLMQDMALMGADISARKVNFSDQNMMRLAAVMTPYVGPSAPELVKRYTLKFDSYDKLILALVSHVPASARQAVVHQLKALQSG